MRKYLVILAVLLGTTVSCEREFIRPAAEGVRISFQTGVPYTRAVTTPGDGVVADGGGIFIDNSNPSNPVPDLVILLAGPDSTIVATYPEQSEGTGIDSELQDDPGATGLGVVFSGFTAEQRDTTYIVYAFANTEGMWVMTPGGASMTGATAKDSLLSLTSVAVIDSLKFIPWGLSPRDTALTIKSGRLPLSAKGTVRVSSGGTGEVSLALIRGVAKITARFINNTGAALSMTNYRNEFVGISPDRSFVLPHVPSAPVDTLARNLISVEELLAIPKDGQDSISWYVFPSKGPYTCNVSFTTSGESYNYTGLQVHDDHARDLSGLERNQHLRIETRISKGTTVSFNLEVTGWIDEKVERILFD